MFSKFICTNIIFITIIFYSFIIKFIYNTF